MKLFYYLLHHILRLMGLLPLRMLYLLSDLLYYLLYYVFRYRKSVVYENLNNSFPEKSAEEIGIIAKGFFRHLSDLIVETVYQSSMDEDEIRQRVRYNNPEVIERYYMEGKHVAGIIGHYCNWEWMCGFPLITSYRCITIYRRLKNKMVDNLMFKMRSRFGAELVQMKMAVRKIYEYNKKDIPTLTAFIADQTPPKEKAEYWVEFLNQDTPVYLGPEKIARKMDMAVVYLRMNKIKRGYYEFDFIPLFDSSEGRSDYEITDAHVAQLEKQIVHKPQFWLWSHRRWKHKRDKKE